MDEIVVIDTVSGTTTPGRVIQKMGDFNGLTEVGTPNPGLLFPASVAFSNDGQTMVETLVLHVISQQGGEPEEEEAAEGAPEAPEALAESDAGDRRSDEEQAG